MARRTTGPTTIIAAITPLSSWATFPKPTPPPDGGTKPPTGQPPHPDHTLPGDLPHPEHPIYWPLPPGVPVDPDYGIPEGGVPPHPDQGLPGAQPHPEHPIVMPPDSGNWLPVYIDNTLPGDLPHPAHPIVLPPDGPAPPEAGSGATIKFKAMWTEETGWVTIGIIIPGGGGKPVPTPSRK